MRLQSDKSFQSRDQASEASAPTNRIACRYSQWLRRQLSLAIPQSQFSLQVVLSASAPCFSFSGRHFAWAHRTTNGQGPPQYIASYLVTTHSPFLFSVVTVNSSLSGAPELLSRLPR